MTGEDELLQESVETIQMIEPICRVTFERDEGQQSGIGARVAVHALNTQSCTLVLEPVNGSCRVTRYERVRAVGWKALRVNLQHLMSPASQATVCSMIADDRR